MDIEIRWILRFQNYEKAFLKLSKIVQINNPQELEQMALIQAFEYTFELGWKTMKDNLYEAGFDVKSPKETIRQAFQSEYINNGDVCIDAIIHRNQSSHAYDDEVLYRTTEFIINKFYNAAEKFYTDFKSKTIEK